MKEHYCRVCGLYIEDKPWGENGQCPTYEICSCCGVEFGYEDYPYKSIIEYRKKWIKNGCKWFDARYKPEKWDFQKQIQDIPNEYK